MLIKRYLLFAGEVFYPEGGWDDLRAAFDTIEDAKKALDDYMERSGDRDAVWAHVVDTSPNPIILERCKSPNPIILERCKKYGQEF